MVLSVGQAKTDATRQGSKKSGLAVSAATWSGCIQVCLFYDEKTDLDHYNVCLKPWQGKGKSKFLVEGVFDK